MFSLIVDSVCQCAPTGAAHKAARFLDLAGAITLIVLGILAASGLGGDLVHSLNTFSGSPIGGWLMIGGGIAALISIHISNVVKKPDMKIAFTVERDLKVNLME